MGSFTPFLYRKVMSRLGQSPSFEQGPLSDKHGHYHMHNGVVVRDEWCRRSASSGSDVSRVDK